MWRHWYGSKSFDKGVNFRGRYGSKTFDKRIDFRGKSGMNGFNSSVEVGMAKAEAADSFFQFVHCDLTSVVLGHGRTS